MKPSRKLWPVVPLSVLVLAAAAAPASATYPGANGDIAFVMQPEASRYGASVFTIAPGGGVARNLTGSIGEDQAPSWSADGKRLVFERRNDDGANLYMIGADGSGEVRLTVDGKSTEPAISPDGRTVAFVLYDDPPSSAHDIYAMDSDGSNLRKLTTEHGFDPSFSPDGTKIAFETQRPPDGRPLDGYLRFNVAIMNADGSNERLLTRDGSSSSPSFSPDESKIVFEANGGIGVMNADGSNRKTLQPGPAFRDPVFSPDGTKIAFSGYAHGGRPSGLYTVGADGTNLRLVTPVKSAPLGADPDWQPLPDDGPCQRRETGTTADDRVVGSPVGDVIRGLEGDDYLRGGAGNDCLYGGTGQDRLAGGAGDDRLDGAHGRDSLSGDAGADVLSGGPLADSLRGGYDDDRLVGGAEADILVGGPGLDSLSGGPGWDRIDARDGIREVVSCGRGVDKAVVDLLDVTSSCERVLRAAETTAATRG